MLYKLWSKMSLKFRLYFRNYEFRRVFTILKTALEKLLVRRFGWTFFIAPQGHPEGGHSVIFTVDGL